MTACTGQPISWLRLESYALGELPAAEKHDIASHLAACPACSECFARIESAPTPDLPLLEPAAVPPRLRGRRWTAWPVWTGLAAAAAAVLLLVRPALEPEPPARRHVKGGDFALELVRVDAEGHLQEASHFADEDRFKAIVTCPPAWRGVVGIAVYQAGRTYTPSSLQLLEDCGNRRAVGGAFEVDGDARALVCASFAASELEWRARLDDAKAPLPGSVCLAVEPSLDKKR
jgi:hypothetical protein